MAISIEENVALLEAIMDRVANAAPKCAMAMGEVHKKKEKELLSMTAHAPVTQTPSAPGSPPAMMPGGLHGDLLESVTLEPGLTGGSYASSIVGPHTIYASTQEYGGVHHSNRGMWLWLGFLSPTEIFRRNWVKKVVSIPERPYVRPSRDDVIDSGAVTIAGNAAFMAQVWG